MPPRNVLVWLLYMSFGTSWAKFCYWPNQSSAPNTVQCGSENWCCYSGDPCMSNGLCRDINNQPNNTMYGLYQVESCVDQGYDGCLSSCRTADSGDRAYLWACNDELTSFCCASFPLVQGDCCANADITLPAAQLLNAIVSSTSSTIQSTSSTIQSTSSTITSLTTSISTSSAVETPLSLTSSPTASSLTSSSAPASFAAVSSTATPTDTASEHGALSSGAKIGIGVGCACVALALLGLLAFWLIKRRPNSRPSDDNVNPHQSLMGETHSVSKQAQHHQTEMYAAPTEKSRMIELDAAGRPMAELHGSTGPVELEGSNEAAKIHQRNWA